MKLIWMIDRSDWIAEDDYGEHEVHSSVVRRWPRLRGIKELSRLEPHSSTPAGSMRIVLGLRR